MPKYITNAQLQELVDALDEEASVYNEKLRRIAGIEARPYIAYQYYDENGNYAGHSDETLLYDLLDNAGVELRDEDIDEIEDASAVDATPVANGQWVLHHTAAGKPYTECSNCCTDFTFRTDKGTLAKLDMRSMLYCPHCGARMDRGDGA